MLNFRVLCMLALFVAQSTFAAESFSLRRPTDTSEVYNLAFFGAFKCACGGGHGLLVSSSGDSLKFCIGHGHVFLGRLYPPDDYLLAYGYLPPPDASHQHVRPQFLEPCSYRESRFVSALQSAVDCALSRDDQERVCNAVQGQLLWDVKMDRVRAIAPIRRDDVEALEFLLFLRSRCADSPDTGESR